MKKKILFYIGTLEGGGAERVLIELLKNLNREKYQLYIALNRPQGFFYNQIPADVQVLDRSYLYRDKTNLFERYFGLASIIKKNSIDLAMGFLPGANRSLMRSRFFTPDNAKMILNEQNNPTFISIADRSLFKEKLEQIEMSLYYPKADGMVVACKGLKQHFLDSMNLASENIHVIYNMIDLAEIQSLALEPVSGIDFEDGIKTIVAAGRLTEQKAYGDMLEVIKKVTKQVPSRLIILGEGPDRKKIENQIKDLSLEGAVYMPGFVDNPFSYMGKADLYLSTSHWEGFHLTIAEAMACGTVPVATDCDYGPREIITDGKNGRLLPVGDVKGISKSLVELLRNKELRDRMSVHAKSRAMDFNVDNIVNDYESMFDRMLEV